MAPPLPGPVPQEEDEDVFEDSDEKLSSGKIALPVIDEDDYLAPRSSQPATYMDIIDGKGTGNAFSSEMLCGCYVCNGYVLWLAFMNELSWMLSFTLLSTIEMIFLSAVVSWAQFLEGENLS